MLSLCKISLVVVVYFAAMDKLDGYPKIDMLPSFKTDAIENVSAGILPKTGLLDDVDSNGLERMLSRGKSLMTAFKYTGIRLVGSSANFMPTPESIFKLNKRLLLGLPQELIAYAINEYCSQALSAKAIQPAFMPNIDEMSFEFLTTSSGGSNLSIPLRNSAQLWGHSSFCRNCETALVITGWNSNTDYKNDALNEMYKAYRQRNINFVFIDTAKYVDTLYIWSAFNTFRVGEIIGEALAQFLNYADVSKIHLVGHSLGAHMCGYAARKFKALTGKEIPRLYGLDPARPCFNEGEVLGGLQRTDATFVEIIHSNAGVLGIKDSIGDVDFYPNGQDPLQPGCLELVCSHSRAFQYYAESLALGNENAFMAKQCNSFKAYKQGRCVGDLKPMGFSSPRDLSGNYYLATNPFSPFAKYY